MKKSTIIIIVIIILIIAGGLYYWSSSKATIPAQPAAVGAANGSVATGAPTAEIKAILAKLRSHLILPTGEDPQIGQIDDPIQAAKVQPFVTGAIKGDLLIVYTKAAKAIVYSPSRDLIVNVGPISTVPEQPVVKTPVTPAKTPAKTPVKK
jgi:hypothetical protein